MNRRQRVWAAVRGEPVDRLPISLWRHFHLQDRTAEGLAAATLDFYRRYEFDLIKVTPSGLYCVEDWGADVAHSGRDDEAPCCRRPVVETPAGWHRLEVLDIGQGALGRELEALRLIGRELAGEAPYVMTVFSPLTIAYKLAGRRVVDDLRQHPADLQAGLAVIAETTARLAGASLAAGADGLFFATQLASAEWLSRAEYEAFGVGYDLPVLEAVAGDTDLLVLHLHGTSVFFDLADRYPVSLISWHNWETWPSLVQARSLTDKAFLAGLDRRLLETGSPAQVEAQARQAVEQAGGRGFILAPACVIPPRSPEDNLRAARRGQHSWPSRQLHQSFNFTEDSGQVRPG